MLWLVLTAMLILLVAAVHLAICKDRLRSLDPIPGEARVWFRPFMIVPLIPVAGLVGYVLAPEALAWRAGLGTVAVAGGLWIAHVFFGQYLLYSELDSLRERRVLNTYVVAMLVCSELAIVCLMYFPLSGVHSSSINLVAMVLGGATMNLVIASLHHRAIIQVAERPEPSPQ